ncbi:hypothetical protein CRENBAI_020673 [Crenichthys baileyi]|uniref:Uncharacterized protein n=1 Tax=Crenichthys baileyi TaxID=28760 RepID=A0AAV9RZW1_9TELE
MEEKGAREKSTGMAKVKSYEADRSEPPNEDRDSAILDELWGLQKEHAEEIQIIDGMNVCIERAHRSLVNKPKEGKAPSRAIIVGFLEYKSPYPAQLKVFLDTGTKTFTTVEEAAPMLKEMGIKVKEDRLERIHHMMAQTSKVTRHRGQQRRPEITEVDLRDLLEG